MKVKYFAVAKLPTIFILGTYLPYMVLAMAYSFSQLQSFQDCPLKYRFEKVDKIGTPSLPALPLMLGSAVHSALEQLYAQRRLLVIPSEDMVVWFFNDSWAHEVDHAKGVMDIPFTNDELDQHKQRGLHYIRRYYETYAPFDQAVTDSVEKNISITMDEWIKLVGKIDRFDIKGDTAIIVDYKTNRSLPADVKDTIKEQLTLYGVAIQQWYTDKFKQIIAKVVYLHLEREYEWVITPDLMKQITERAMEVIQKIEHARFQLNMWDEQAFPATPGNHCDYCPFKRLCPVYKHMFADDEEMQVDELGKTTIKNLIDKVWDVTMQMKLLEEKKDSYVATLKAYVQKVWFLQRLRWFKTKLKVDIKREYDIDKEDIETLQKILTAKWRWDLVKEEKLQKKKLDQSIKDGKIPLADVWELVSLQEKYIIGRAKPLTEKEVDETQDEVGE